MKWNIHEMGSGVSKQATKAVGYYQKKRKKKKDSLILSQFYSVDKGG